MKKKIIFILAAAIMAFVCRTEEKYEVHPLIND